VEKVLAQNRLDNEKNSGEALWGWLLAGASAIAGFFASACSLPFDYVKTQMQKMKALPDGTMPYSSAMDCAAKTLKEGGPLKFYTGFPTYFVRIAPHAMVRLLFTPAAGLDRGLTTCSAWQPLSFMPSSVTSPCSCELGE
jgi:solute carrier family 25 oxoglutarate transporter 11